MTVELRNSCSQPRIISKSQVADILRGNLLDSISHHLISDVPVGIFLSSGLDSATILALARETADDQLNSFTLGFKEYVNTNSDETQLAGQIAEHYKIRHSTQFIHKEDFLQNLEHIYTVMDQPTIDGINSYFVCKGAHDAGIKVALSGLGGDELFAGYPTFYQIPKLTNALGTFRQLPTVGTALRYIFAPLLKHFTSPKYASLLEYGGSTAGAYLLRRGLFMPWELPNFLDGEIVRQGWHDLHTMSYLEQTVSGICNQRLQITALETAWYMKNQLLRDNDWASMAHSLELRVPLVDITLFRSITGLIGSGINYSKQDMASTPAHKLPDTILGRKKTGFSIPVNQWLTAVNPQAKYSRGLRGWAATVFLGSGKLK